MNRLPLSLMRRKALAGFGLALFVLGINYCLVGAMTMSGHAMPCMPSMASATASADEMPAAHGGHCAGMATAADADEEAPPTAPAPPCCIALTPVLAPEIGKVAPTAMLIVPTVIEEELLVSTPATPGRLLRAPPGEFVAPLLLSAPTSSRAPPSA